MKIVPNIADLALIAATMLVFGLEPWLTKRVKAAIEGGSPFARLRAFQWETAVLWSACIAALVIWFASDRPWQALYLGETESWRLLLGFAFAGALVWIGFRDRRVLLSRPDVLAKYRGQMERVEHLLPRTAAETQWWMVMSLTAGITEEILCRGYLLSIVAHFTGLWIAAPIAAVFFGLGHAYQGREGIIRTSVFGLIFTAIVLVSGSLIPAILLHATIDLISGDLGRRIVTTPEAAS